MRGVGLGRDNEDALNARIAELEARVARLTEALKRIAEGVVSPSEVARAALEGNNDESV